MNTVETQMESLNQTTDQKHIHLNNIENLKEKMEKSDHGITLWLTGLSGAGKTTIGTALVDKLSLIGNRVKLLDGDELRKGINKDLKFSPEDRKENIRRTAEIAAMFTQSGFVTIVTLISPYIKDREMAKQLHYENSLTFLEIYIKTPIDVCEKRDPKGLYKLARTKSITDMTGIQAPYEEPVRPFLTLATDSLSIEQCASILFDCISNNITIQKTVAFESVEELICPEKNLQDVIYHSRDLPKLELKKIDVEWMQVLSEGWAFPLRGFMREVEFLQCIHFSMVKDRNTDRWHILPIPIVLDIDDATKEELSDRDSKEISLIYDSHCIGIMKNIEIYPHRKEERCNRVFGIYSSKHPAIEAIKQSGSWLLGGDIEIFEKICWNDGLDIYRLTPNEIKEKIYTAKCDAICAFQLRNPIHNGHALLMRNTIQMLKDKKYNNPMLLLHPLGGWTKNDDVPLSVRIEQHEAVFQSGELNNKETILAIFPSPMSYAGPTEVLWHCKARLICGVNFYIVGRDPAGIPHPDIPGNDLYDHTHGAKILLNAPHLDNLKIVPFPTIAYNCVNQKMEIYDPQRKSDFLFISGTKMRNLAKEGGSLPDGFMVPEAWNVISKYYKSIGN